MRVIAKYRDGAVPPLLILHIHGAPGRRIVLEYVELAHEYRRHLRAACMRADVLLPIDYPIDLSVMFVNPEAPDLDNLVTALYQAMDGKSLTGPGIIVDDGLIQAVTMAKMYTGQSEKGERTIALPKYITMAAAE